MEIAYPDPRLFEAKMAVIVEEQTMNLVRIFGLVPYKDGNAWCVLLGEDIQSGIVGFGATPLLAVYAFNKAFNEVESQCSPPS